MELKLWMLIVVIVTIIAAYQFHKHLKYRDDKTWTILDTISFIWLLIVFVTILCKWTYQFLDWTVHTVIPKLTPFLDYTIYP